MDLKKKDYVIEELSDSSYKHKKHVSVIIPVFNDYARLSLCIKALERQSFHRDEFEIIVIDNGLSIEYKAKLWENTKILFYNEKTPGSYAARNKGIILSNAEILAFTDSDCVPDKDWIARGVNALSSGNNIGLVGGKIEFFFKNPGKPNIWEIYDSRTYLNQQYAIKFSRFAATANMFTKKEIFNNVGLFNSSLKSGGDREWGERVFSAGYMLKYADDAVIYHPARASFFEIKKRYRRIYGGCHQMYNYKLSHHALISFCGNVIVDLSPPVRFMRRILQDSNISGIRTKAKVIGVHMLAKLSRLYYRFKYLFGAQPTRS